MTVLTNYSDLQSGLIHLQSELKARRDDLESLTFGLRLTLGDQGQFENHQLAARRIRIKNFQDRIGAISRAIQDLLKSIAFIEERIRVEVPPFVEKVFGNLDTETRMQFTDQQAKISAHRQLIGYSECLSQSVDIPEQAKKHFSKRLNAIVRLIDFLETRRVSFQDHGLYIRTPHHAVRYALAPNLRPDACSNRAHISIIPHLIVARVNDPYYYYVTDSIVLDRGSVDLDTFLSACDIADKIINDLDSIFELPITNLFSDREKPALKISLIKDLNGFIMGRRTKEEVLTGFKNGAIQDVTTTKGYLQGKHPLPTNSTDKYAYKLLPLLSQFQTNKDLVLACLEAIHSVLDQWLTTKTA